MTDSDGETSADPADEHVPSRWVRSRSLIALVLLAVTAVATAWCSFEAAKWGGEMSVAFSQASSARIAAGRAQGTANTARQDDLAVWAIYIQAELDGDDKVADYAVERFSEELGVAYRAWESQARPTKGPFRMTEYVPPGTREAIDADATADQRFAEALSDIQRADNYRLLTVLFALVLFFSALSNTVSGLLRQWTLLGTAVALFFTCLIVAATFPVII